MNKIFFTCYSLVFLFFIGCVGKSNKRPEERAHSKGKMIIGYVNGWNDNWGDGFEKAKQLTHINYAFANIANGKVIEGRKTDSVILRKLNQLKQVNKDLKILISVGGWSWSKNFSDAVLTIESRQVFANSAIDFLLRHKLDGIDLDWEYPGQKGDNNTFRSEDKENFTSILKLLREKLDSIGDKKDHYLLTIASGANQNYLNHTNMKEAHHYLDFINIMTYDFYTGGSKHTGHHANLYNSELDDYVKRSAANAVDEHIKAEIPVEKLVLGVPFYGRWWKGVNPINKGSYQKVKGKTGSYSYNTIKDSLRNNVFTSYWDSTALAPYVWRDIDSFFISYENVLSLKHKTEFVNRKGLGGIMFWQFNHDNGDLLNAISNGLESK